MNGDRGRRVRLAAEFALLFVAAPVAVAVLLPPSAMFGALFALMAAGLVLLHLTPGFRWRDLWRGAGRIGWRRVAVLGAATAGVCWAVVTLFAPQAAFGLFDQPRLLLTILLLYPLVSALPQEIVFRPLFFRRYGSLLPAGRGALILNAAIFALAHLMYWNAIVAAMTFAGGLAFAWSYERRGNFPEAVVLHGMAGNILFTFGLGVFFYSGNVVRPF